MNTAAPIAGDPGRAPAVRDMFARIAGGYDRANTVLSFGIDRWWRRQALVELGPRVRGDALDLCAGTLDFSAMLAGRSQSVTALDFCQEMLDAGKAKAPGATLVCADARELPMANGSFDVVVAGFGLRNVPEPHRALAEVRRVLRPGGVFVCLDFFQPTNLWARTVDRSYNRVVLPIVGGMIAGDVSAYRYLADSMAAWTTRTGFEGMCRDAGLVDVVGRDLLPPIASLVVGKAP